MAPTIAISGASSVNEGTPYSLTLGAVTDPGVDTVTSYIVHWGDGSPNSTFTSAGVKTHVYDGPGTYAITVDLVDGDGTHLNRANARSVTVNNIAPVVTAPPAQNATEGASASFALGSFTDPGADSPWQVTVNWGDGSANTVFTVSSPGTLPPRSHTYADDGQYTVTVTVREENGGGASGFASFFVNPSNVVPIVTAPAAQSADTGAETSFELGSFSDVGADSPWQVTVNWGDGSNDTVFAVNTPGTLPPRNHTYAVAGQYTVTVTVHEDNGLGAFNAGSFLVDAINVAPTVTAPAAQDAVEGASTSFDLGSFTDASGAEHWQVAVNWGDGSADTVFGVITPGALPPQDHTYADDGQYTVTVTVTVRGETGPGAFGFASFLVNTSNVRPVVLPPEAQNAGFEGQPTWFVPGSFTDPGRDGPWLVTVNWGDGSADTVFQMDEPFDFPAQSHTYADDGSYTATITVHEEGGGEFGAGTLQIDIHNFRPDLDISGAASVDEGSLYTLSLASTDPGADTIDHWTINWGDGRIETVSGNPSSATHTYADGDNTYTISATATDEDGTFNANTISVNVTNVAPVVFVPANQIADEGASTSFELGSFTDPGADSPWQVTVNWGDGSADTVFTMNSPGAIPNQDHTFADNGARNVTVSVRDKNGGAHHPVIFVVVGNIAPTLTISGDSSVEEGSLYTLNLASSDPGADTIDHWTINWGDGHVETVSGNPSSITHTYADGDAAYTISATATDEDGTFHANTIDVGVNNIAPVVTAAIDQHADEGASTSFDLGSFTDPGADGFWRVIVNWGDGSADTVFGVNTPGALPPQDHTYADDGAYSITVTVIENHGAGASGVARFLVNVSNVPPVVIPPDTQIAFEGNPAWFVPGSFTDPGPDGPWQVTVNWGDGSADTVFQMDEPFDFPAQSHTYADDGRYTATVTVHEEGSGVFGVESFQIDVHNVRPTLRVSGAASVDEGSLYTLALASEDPGADTIDHWTINWGDGHIETVSGDRSSATHVYRDDDPAATPMDPYSIRVSATDEDGTYLYTGKLSVQVINVAPGHEAGSDETLAPAQAGAFSRGPIPFSDPGADVWTGTVNYGDGTGDQELSVDQADKTYSLSHTYTVEGTYTVTVSLQDDDGDPVIDTFQVTVVLNQPPTVAADRDAVSANEGSEAVSTGTFFDAQGNNTVSLHASAGVVAKDDVTGTWTWSAPAIEGPAGPTLVTITATDHLGETATTSFTYTVDNVAPQDLSLGLDATAIDENGWATLSGTFTDPGTLDTHTVTINWGDGSPDTVVTLGAGVTSFSGISHQYLDNPTNTSSNSYTIDVTVADDDSGSVAGSTSIVVTNVAPVIDTLAATSADEGGIVRLTGTYHDVGTQDTHTLTVDWGEIAPVTYVVSGGSFDITHQYLDDNPSGTSSDVYTISVILTDDDNGTDTASTTTTISNAAPVLANLTNSSPDCCMAFMGDGVVEIAAAFTDIGSLDSHIVSIDWGDGTTTSGAVSATNGNGTVSDSHIYAAGGIFTITVTVTDDDGGQTQLQTTAVVGGVGLHNGQLQIIGTAGRDIVNVTRHGSIYRVDTRLDAQWRDHDDDHDWDDDHDNDHHDDDDDDRHKFSTRHQHYTFSAANVSSILIIGCDGNDQLRVGRSVTVPATIDGGMGNDRIWSGAGNDVIIDLFGNNRIHAGQGNDTVTTGAGDDRIWTDGGNDTINAGNGNNRVYSGGGNDIIVTGSGDDYVWSDGGADYINVGDGDNHVHGGGGNNIIIAGSGRDRIWTRSGNDVIHSGGGNDEIHAGDGDDVIHAGDGDNHVSSGAGNDTIIVGHGNNSIMAGSGDDIIETGNGNNIVEAGAGNDLVTCGSGDDVIDAGAGNDIVHAGAGNDTVHGGAGSDILDGGAGNDTLTGGADKDLLIGGDGRDTLTGDAGNDILIGGYCTNLTDTQLASILSNWVNAPSYAAGVAATTGSSGTKFITDGINQNVFSDLSDDKLTGSAGQDLFLVDTTLDEAGAVKDLITDANNSEILADIDSL